MDWTEKKIAYDKSNHTKCAIAGCDSHTGYGRKYLCEKHYMRIRRKGTSEKYTPKTEYKHSSGYIIVRCEHDHPLSVRSGRLIEYKHRVVFYDKYGDGPFNCHWCGKLLMWDGMHIDHLDDDVTNNSVTNLVASCPVCNTKRGMHKMVVKMRAKGVMLTFNGETLCLGEWARKLKISRQSIAFRINAGWPLDRALSAPRGKTGPRAKGNNR